MQELCELYHLDERNQEITVDVVYAFNNGIFNYSYFDPDYDTLYGLININKLPQPCMDYLKLRGYILPFTYLSDENKPVTLPEDEIIKLGWAVVEEK